MCGAAGTGTCLAWARVLSRPSPCGGSPVCARDKARRKAASFDLPVLLKEEPDMGKSPGFKKPARPLADVTEPEGAAVVRRQAGEAEKDLG